MKKNTKVMGFVVLLLSLLFTTKGVAPALAHESLLEHDHKPGVLGDRIEHRDAVIQNITERVELRFSRHRERLSDWIERATKHAEKLEAKGKDIAPTLDAIEAAKASLGAANTLADEAIAKLKAVSSESWLQQKEDALAARQAVVEAQIAYAEVIKDMKQVIVELKEAAK